MTSRRSDIEGDYLATDEEYARLYGKYVAATAEAFANLQKCGASSEKFHEAATARQSYGVNFARLKTLNSA
jgi:hypothetical protein